MSKLSESIVEKIKKENITPIPKWQIFMKKQFIWSLVAVAVLLGAVSVAIGLHLLIVPIDHLPDNSAREQLWSLLMRIPFLWVGLLALFLYVAYHNFLHTEDGYKWRTFQVFGGTVLVSVILGAVMLLTGFAPWLNSQLVRNIPGYSKYGDRRGVVWMNPGAGRLAGRIISIDKASPLFTLRDLKGQLWVVSYDNLVLSGVELKEGEFIKIIGQQGDTASFTATEVRPWEGRGQMKRMQGNGSLQRITK